MPRAVVGQTRERLWEQLGHEIEDLRLHVVHLGVLNKADPMIVHGALPELCEGALDLLADIRLAAVLADRDAAAANVDFIGDGG